MPRKERSRQLVGKLGPKYFGDLKAQYEKERDDLLLTESKWRRRSRMKNKFPGKMSRYGTPQYLYEREQKPEVVSFRKKWKNYSFFRDPFFD